MMRPGYAALLLAPLTCSMAACNLSEFTVNTTAPVLLQASKTFSMESDVEFAREAVAGQLKTADGFLASAPQNQAILEVLAQGYLEFGFGFLEDELESMPDDSAHHDAREKLAQRCTVFYDRARGYAFRNLQGFGKGVTAASKADIDGFKAALDKLPNEAAPGLLYGGMAWASAINLNRSDIARIADLPKAVAMVRRSYDLDKRLHFANAAMALGLVAASQGKAMGGDPDAAKRYFSEADALNNHTYLMTKVFEARFLAVVLQDRAMFDRLLHEVIAAPADAMPSARLPNELAKRRAARYLKQAEDFF